MTPVTPRSRSPWPRILRLCAAYAAAVVISRLLPSQNAIYISFWLPAGVYVAGLLRAETADWPALILAVTVVNVGLDLAEGTSLLLAVALALANMAEAVASAQLFRRYVARTTQLATLGEFLGLVACAVLGGAPAGATLGAAALKFSGVSPSYLPTWIAWWIGNSMAILLVAPFGLIWAARPEAAQRWWREKRRLAEAAAIAFGLFACAWLIMVLGPGLASPYISVLVVFILWAALRFGTRGASALNLLFSLILTALASEYLRQAAAAGPESSQIVVLQVFMTIGALAGLIPAIVVAERDQLLRQLGFSEERYRNLSAAAQEAVVISENGRIVDVNDQALELFGFSRAEMVGRKAAEVVSPESRQLVAAAIAADAEVSYEHKLLRKDGQAFAAEARAKVMRQGDRKLRMTAIRDITGRKREEAERQDFERKLQEMQKLESLGVLAGGIAHDFNNLLTSILGNASLASLDLPADSPAQHNLESIQKGSLRAADLCKQMLAYSGQGRFVVKRIALNRLVQETTQLLELSISKTTALQFSLAPSLPPIEADETQLRQVVMNLVINASEATGERAGVIHVSTGVAHVDRPYLAATVNAPDLPEGNYAWLEVSDSGSGMSADVQAKIFDPFFTTKFAGRGLGLSAVLGIVRGHKGAIRMYSEPSRGTTFKVLLPAVEGPAEAVPPGAAPAAPWRGRGCVLVVDDDESVRGTAALMLERHGLDVAVAGDGREAVEIFRRDPDRFALVLMDLTMPRLDGAGAFAEMRLLRPAVQVILMSGFNEQEATSRFAGKGLASFLQKPFHYDVLSRVVRDVLARAGVPPAL